MSSERHNNPWTEQELEESVIQYVELRYKILNNIKTTKISHYRKLCQKFNTRNEAAYERRMCNISYIYQNLKMKWTPGLKPYSHIGPTNEPILREFVLKYEPELKNKKLKNDVKKHKVSSKLISLNKKKKQSSKVKKNRKKTIMIQKEDMLVDRYHRFIRQNNLGTLKANQIDFGNGEFIYTDAWVDKTKTLIEAKSNTERSSIRMAIGQLHDYKRHHKPKPKNLAVLLPNLPNEDLVSLIHSQNIDVIYEDGIEFYEKKF